MSEDVGLNELELGLSEGLGVLGEWVQGEGGMHRAKVRGASIDRDQVVTQVKDVS